MSVVKGIILAGGKGSRLYPATHAVCKQLLPIYDKPMIYYPLASLMEMGIKEVMIVAAPEELPRFVQLFGSGEHLGIEIVYEKQLFPRGIAEALIIAQKWLQGSRSVLILGDNIFYGHRFSRSLDRFQAKVEGAMVFGYAVKDPNRYGVMEFDENNELIAIVEKPQKAPSSYAVTGLYFYDGRAPLFAGKLRPSLRGELEITDLNNLYLKEGTLDYDILDVGTAWLDTGTADSLQDASAYVRTIQERQGIQIGCLEEIAWKQGYISKEALEARGKALLPSSYGEHICHLATKELQMRTKKAEYSTL